MKKILALVLALLMLVSLFAACGKKDDGNSNNPGDKGPTNTDTNDDGVVVKKFGGADYTILTRTPNSDTPDEFVGAAGGSYVQEAIAQRRVTVERDYDVNIEVITKPGGWTEAGDQIVSFTEAVVSERMGGGTDGFDLVATHSVYLGWMSVKGNAKDMSKYSEYIHFDKPWWNQNLYDALNLDGHVFMMIGDIGQILYEYINVMFVNESKFEDTFHSEGGVDYLYELVESGDWTWDKLWQFASKFGTGAGGDEKYGLYVGAHGWRASFVSQDASFFTKDARGKLDLPGTLNQKLYYIVRDMVEYYAKDNIAIAGGWNDGSGVINNKFIAGEVLFYPQTLNQASKIFGNGTDDYGIVPLPKYNSEQEQYKTQCRDTVTGIMMIDSTKDPERTAIVTEAMVYWGHKLIVPTYYETSLVDRYLPKYTAILDEIREGLTYTATDAFVQNISGEASSKAGGTMRWDKFYNTVANQTGADPMALYESDVYKGRGELNKFYQNIAALGVTYD